MGVASPTERHDLQQRPLLARLSALEGHGRDDRLLGDGFAPLYSDALLLDQPLPDFSMPYNVILMTGTLQSMLIGGIMSLLLRRARASGDGGGSGGLFSLLRRLRGR